MFEESNEEQLMFAVRMMNPSLSESDEYEQFIQLIQRIGQIQLILESKTLNQDAWYIEVMGQKIEIDLLKHIEKTKVQLDIFIQRYLDGSNSDQVIVGHRKLSNILNQLKTSVLENENKNSQSVVMDISEQNNVNQQRNSQYLEEQNTFAKRNSFYSSRDSNDPSKQSELKEELENEIFEMSQVMKNIAQNINNHLNKDKDIIKKLDKQQDGNIHLVKQSRSRIHKFMGSKSLSFITLLFMFIIALCAFIFGLIFIKLF